MSALLPYEGIAPPNLSDGAVTYIDIAYLSISDIHDYITKYILLFCLVWDVPNIPDGIPSVADSDVT